MHLGNLFYCLFSHYLIVSYSLSNYSPYSQVKKPTHPLSNPIYNATPSPPPKREELLGSDERFPIQMDDEKKIKQIHHLEKHLKIKHALRLLKENPYSPKPWKYLQRENLLGNNFPLLYVQKFPCSSVPTKKSVFGPLMDTWNKDAMDTSFDFL
jgi:hypothetical protein